MAIASVKRLTAGATLGIFFVLSVLSWQENLEKVLVIGWVAFLAMTVPTAFLRSAQTSVRPRGLVWAYGLSAGAMITSAGMFLLPQAIGLDPQLGGLGVAIGVIAGFSAHSIGHRLTHLASDVDHTIIELSGHAIAAGAIIGVIYHAMPTLGLVLGLAIISHKAPAGYVTARRLRQQSKPLWPLLIPATGVGSMAMAVAFVAPPVPVPVRAVVFGFAAGVFLHVAMDFLPRCEIGGDIYEVVATDEQSHHLLDSLRLHAVGSTAVGGAVVFLAWLALTG